MHIVTGGAGFIGSVFVAGLNAKGIDDILIVDELERSSKWLNIRARRFADYLHKDEFLTRVEKGEFSKGVKSITHLGACSTTTETDVDFLVKNNFHYSRTLAQFALSRGLRFVYASSAATYGAGEAGYSDDLREISALRPLNPYGYSKQLFDMWVVRNNLLDKVCGLKYFNVYGPNEYHKEDQRSVVHKAFEQINATGKVKLFKSYRSEYADGDQKRDFVYVKDCVTSMLWLLEHTKVNGIFNLGSGAARSWNDLAKAIFAALGRTPAIEYIEMPDALARQYQYFTKAEMEKLAATGCPVPKSSLEEGVKDYVQGYLLKDTYL